MPSKAIASLDAWLEAAEHLLQEQRELSLLAVESDTSFEQKTTTSWGSFWSSAHD
jgi:hypothetical protein